MGQGPFATRKGSSQSAANRRRSTRIDHETPVVLSGRDATGQTYRDETITEIVNIHGARVRTERKILVGMLVSIESVKTGRGSKAVCVNVYEKAPDQPHAAIAIQLLQPGNIWGVENPPSDWAVVAATMGGKTSPADSSWSGLVFSQSTLPPRVKSFSAEPARTSGPDPAQADRAQKIAEESLSKLAEGMDAASRNALAGYEHTLSERVSEAEARLAQRVEEAAAELAAAIQTLKGNVVSEMVETTVEESRVRLGVLSRECEERISQRTEHLVSESTEQLAVKSAEEIRGCEAALEQWLDGSMRKTQADLAARANESARLLAESGERLAGKSAEYAQLRQSEFQQRLEALMRSVEADLTARANESARLVTETGERLAAQSAQDAQARQSEFEQRLEALMRKTEAAVTTRVNEALQGFEAVLNTFRASFADELSAQQEKAILEAEQAVRARIAAMLSSITAQPQSVPVDPDRPVRK